MIGLVAHGKLNTHVVLHQPDLRRSCALAAKLKYNHLHVNLQRYIPAARTYTSILNVNTTNHIAGTIRG